MLRARAILAPRFLRDECEPVFSTANRIESRTSPGTLQIRSAVCTRSRTIGSRRRIASCIACSKQIPQSPSPSRLRRDSAGIAAIRGAAERLLVALLDIDGDAGDVFWSHMCQLRDAIESLPKLYGELEDELRAEERAAS